VPTPFIFLRIAILGAAIFVAGCNGLGNGCEPHDHTDRTVPVASIPEPVDAGTGKTIDDLVADCQAAAVDCIVLCKQVFGPGYHFITCEVVTGDAGLAVHAVYDTTCSI